MDEYSKKLTEAELELKVRLDLAFSDMTSAQITKKQYSPRGRKVFLPIMAVLATVIYAIFIYFSSIITMYYRWIVMPIETLVWLFFMVRFALSFVTDLKSKDFAEKITFVTDEEGKKFFVGEGRYVKKLEYEGGNIVMWGKDNYEKFSDKSKLNRLATKYDKHLQRRSSNYAALNADNLFDLLRAGSFIVTDNAITSESETGSFSIKFDDKYIKSIYYVGKPEQFYDSASPLHILDCFLPFDYVISYTFNQINQIKEVDVSALAKTALQDYLLPPITSKAVKFL